MHIQEQVDTCWFDGGGKLPPEWATCGYADYAGGTVLRVGQRIVLAASAEEVWERIRRIGGRSGYYFAQPLWRLRWMIDRAVARRIGKPVLEKVHRIAVEDPVVCRL